MVSDQEFHFLNNELKPIAADLRVKLQSLEQGKPATLLMPLIQPLLEQLAPYRKDRPWLEEYLSKVEETVAPYMEYYRQYRRSLTIFYVILGVLAIVPLVAWFLTRDPFLVFLLALPIPGWYFLGIRPFLKKHKPGV